MRCHPTPTRLLTCLLLLALAAAGCGPQQLDDPWHADAASHGWAVHTVCGGASTVPGIDVSKWQGTVNWSQVKSAGIKFAIARVSDGTTYIDGQFKANWSGMQKVGLIRGAYQYFRPTVDPIAQANLFVDKINAAGGLKSDDMPGVLDIETTGGASASKVLKAVDAWVARVEQRTNRRPIIYTGSYFWDGNVFSKKYASYPLWTAHYTSKKCPLVPDPWKKWTIWQYTSSAKVSGVSGNVDANRFNGTLSELKAFIANSVIKPPPKPDAGVPDSKPPPEPDQGGPAADGGVGPDTGTGADLGTPRIDQGLPPGTDAWSCPNCPACNCEEPRCLSGGCAVSIGQAARPAGGPGLVVLCGLLAVLLPARRRRPR